ncbi:hypothetical protein [Amycolatopsis arida]|nr:hypothetical protein [Amycolatopsis arida]TDX84971.1 hypothetical protein CLV69_11755 [Amycolatopsis arida]
MTDHIDAERLALVNIYAAAHLRANGLTAIVTFDDEDDVVEADSTDTDSS